MKQKGLKSTTARQTGRPSQKSLWSRLMVQMHVILMMLSLLKSALTLKGVAFTLSSQLQMYPTMYAQILRLIMRPTVVENSTYFPDRVVPMLPEALSNDLCSLRPREDRACMAFHLWIDDKGELQKT